MKIKYKKLKKNNISPELFRSFDRHQEVTHCYRKEEGKWVIKEISFVEEWGEEEIKELVQCLKNTLDTGGAVWGAFERGVCIGFTSVEAERFGTDRGYVELSCLHISNGYRRHGIGKKLFSLACYSAQWLGAKRLYISSHSATETQAFYKAMGCIEAREYKKEAVEKEPCDCQLEYQLHGLKAYRGMFLLLGILAGGFYGNVVLKRTILGTIVGVCFASFFYYFLNAKEISSFKK